MLDYLELSMTRILIHNHKKICLVSWRSCQFLCLAFLSRRAVSNGFVQKIIASKESNCKQVYLQQFDSCNYLYE